MATNYDINYNDERFTEVEADKKAALNEVDKTYGEMIGQSDKFYQAQIDASKQWADKQTQLQQEKTDFAIEQIEQQKGQAKKDYTKEQSGAYVDWQKQSNQYGANAEAMAAQGMQNTGFSESSQVSMYNTYQNRVAAARESYNQAVLNYNNAIKDARLQNNSILAEIAANALQQQLELSLQGFQYKNTLILEQANKKLEVDNTYYQRYQDVLNQINTENALAEEVRQYNQTYAENVRQFNENYKMKVKEYEEGIRQFNEEIARLKAKDAEEHKMEIQKLELQKQALAQEKAEADRAYQLEQAKLAEEKRQFDKTHSSSGGTISKSSGGSSGSTSKTGNNSISSSKKSQVDKLVEGKQDSMSNKVDMNSVLSLGYGPISAARAYELVKQGIAETYTKNGKTYFRLTAYARKQNQLFGGTSGKF